MNDNQTQGYMDIIRRGPTGSMIGDSATRDQMAELRTLRAKLARIEALARKRYTPAVNTGAHALAAEILKVIEGEK